MREKPVSKDDSAELKFVVPQTAQNERLDKFLAGLLVDAYSRTKLQALIQSSCVTVDGKTVSAHHKVAQGEVIVVKPPREREIEARPENIPLNIISEDDSIIIVNKPAGMVVHPACGNPNHTLVNALLYHARKKLSSVGGFDRPGIVHRLDKDTSGLLVVAKNDQAHRYLAEQFKSHDIKRIYIAYVKGRVEHDEFRSTEPVGRAFVNRKKVVVKPSGGKDAMTNFKVAKRFSKATKVEAYPETGRTHQIRVHLAFSGYPILGDKLYGFASPYIKRHALHAAVIGFRHPQTKQWVEFKADVPKDLKTLEEYLGKGE